MQRAKRPQDRNHRKRVLFEGALDILDATRLANMKIQILLIIFLSPLASLSNTFDASAQEISACAVLGTESIPFQRATRQTDPAYHKIETASYKGVKFCLKAGHGVARLEAVIQRRLVASTFYSYGRDPKETDSLRLSVRAPNGKQVEAQCFNVDFSFALSSTLANLHNAGERICGVWTAPDFPEPILVEDYAAILGSSRVA